MARDRGQLIDGLVGELTPTRGPRRIETLAALWLVASWLAVLGIALAEAPLRDGWRHQLMGHPRFLLENLLGLLAGAAAIVGAFRLAVPGPGRTRDRLGLPLLFLGLWVGGYLVALVSPALAPSTAGMRAGCWHQVIAYSALPLLFALVLLRRLAPFARATTGAIAGAAAGALPALLMQLACMYVPAHILTYHLAPVLVVAGVGAALGALSLRRV